MSHWQEYHTQWETVGPPLRTDPSVVKLMATLTRSLRGPVLLLGVTPELADAFDEVKAIDKNPAMIDKVWPGDSRNKKAIAGDWLEMGGPGNLYSAVVGDGSLNNIAFPGEIAPLLARVIDLLLPGGRFACRLFERPDAPLTWRDLAAAGTYPATVNFHAFKWQLAMRIAADEGANIPVTSILQRFEDLFPDRDKLSEMTGWSRRAIGTIDIYRGSPVIYSFPSRAEFLSCIPAEASNAAFLVCGDYDLAACCPILTFEKRQEF